MYQIQQITNDYLQTQTLLLPDGGQIVMTMKFVPMQFGWFIVSLQYNNFILEGVRIVNSPNMLHQFRNQIPFGLACFSTQNREPSLQQDFSTQASIMYVLSQAEVEAYTVFLSE